jgi:hypothetical protein
VFIVTKVERIDDVRLTKSKPSIFGEILFPTYTIKASKDSIHISLS